MLRDDDLLPVLRWSSASCVMEQHEPDDLVYEAAGELYGVDDSGAESLLGKFRIYYVDVERAINEGEGVFDVLDAHSSHVAEYFEPIFGSQAPDFSHELQEAVDYEIIGSNLLILDRLELLPQYRGKRLGLRLINHMIARFGAGAAIVAIKPFPLQFEANIRDESDEWRAKLALGKFSTERNTAFGRLRNYYGELGFIPLPNSPFQVFSMAWPLRRLEDV